VDQGGCIETIKPTTHTKPTYVVEGVIHYAVANMPGAVARTSTIALTNATFPFACEIANKGYAAAALDNETIWTGINVIDGKITDQAVAEAFRMKYVPLEDVLV
ncbi:MAG TPA: hypothetical protein VLA34_04805, partial [Candidatus Krumholzibacterium sp.]|nr:hypothetical protein [Candidatus Krumholzibacterium sp.]